MTDRAPHEQVDEVESSRVVRREETLELHRALVARLEVRDAVLHGQTLLRHAVTLQVQERKASEEERPSRARADGERRRVADRRDGRESLARGAHDTRGLERLESTSGDGRHLHKKGLK